VQVLSNSIKEELPAVVLVVNNTLTLNGASDVVHNAFKFFIVEEFVDFT
jgi:hypothetical protein